MLGLGEDDLPGLPLDTLEALYRSQAPAQGLGLGLGSGCCVSINTMVFYAKSAVLTPPH